MVSQMKENSDGREDFDFLIGKARREQKYRDVFSARVMQVRQRMNLPLNSPDGQIMSYKLHHRRTGQT